MLKDAQCEPQPRGFLHMILRCRVLSLVCTLRSHRSVLNLPPRLSKQARADWQAPARWRHPFIRALTPVSLAPLGRSPWRRQTRGLALLHSPAWMQRAEPWEQTGSGALSFIYHLKAAGPDYRPAHLQSRRCQPETEEEEEEEGSAWCCYRILTLNNCCIPPHSPLWLLYGPEATITLKNFSLFAGINFSLFSMMIGYYVK